MATSYADKLKERAKLDAELKQMAADEMKRLRDTHTADLEISGFKFEDVWAEYLGSKQTKPAAKGKKGGSSEAKPPSHSWKDGAGKVHYVQSTGKASEALRASDFYRDGKILRENMYKLTEADQKKWLADNAKK